MPPIFRMTLFSCSMTPEKPIHVTDQRSPLSSCGNISGAKITHCGHTGCVGNHRWVPYLQGGRTWGVFTYIVVDGLSVRGYEVDPLLALHAAAFNAARADLASQSPISKFRTLIKSTLLVLGSQICSMPLRCAVSKRK